MGRRFSDAEITAISAAVDNAAAAAELQRAVETGSVRAVALADTVVRLRVGWSVDLGDGWLLGQAEGGRVALRRYEPPPATPELEAAAEPPPAGAARLVESAG
jgi:hypothetical protein